MIKDELPKAYEEIAEQIGIDIDDYTIFDDYAQYFKNVKKFGIPEMFNLYQTIFMIPCKSANNNHFPVTTLSS